MCMAPFVNCRLALVNCRLESISIVILGCQPGIHLLPLGRSRNRSDAMPMPVAMPMPMAPGALAEPFRGYAYGHA